jgi:hypothetical protein
MEIVEIIFMAENTSGGTIPLPNSKLDEGQRETSM